jgi:hypothetical protein
LSELSFEFDQAGKIIDCIGTIKVGGNIEALGEARSTVPSISTSDDGQDLPAA